MKKNNLIFTGILLSIMLIPLSQLAFAQYHTPDKGTLYNWMEDPANKKRLATSPGSFGSGVPYFAADGLLGASILSGGIFGGIAAMFFIRGRKGKYAAMGRG